MRIEDQFTKLKISRQRKYQLRRIYAGKCRQCGNRPRLDAGEKHFAQLCNSCGLKNQRRQRKAQGVNPQYKSGRGRKPIYKIVRKKNV